MGNGMTTLARATAVADLNGPRAYGVIGGVAGGMTTAARALGPLGAAVLAAAVGSDAMLWTPVALSARAGTLARLHDRVAID
jgi:hypothetical protein